MENSMIYRFQTNDEELIYYSTTWPFHTIKQPIKITVYDKNEPFYILASDIFIPEWHGWIINEPDNHIECFLKSQDSILTPLQTCNVTFINSGLILENDLWKSDKELFQTKVKESFEYVKNIYSLCLDSLNYIPCDETILNLFFEQMNFWLSSIRYKDFPTYSQFSVEIVFPEHLEKGDYSLIYTFKADLYGIPYCGTDILAPLRVI